MHNKIGGVHIMKNERPSFLDFYKGSFTNRLLFKNNRTGKLYIEKDAYRNRKYIEYIVLISPIVILIIYLLVPNKFDTIFLEFQTLFSIVMAFLIYPLRFFVVTFDKVDKKPDAIGRKFRKSEKYLIFSYVFIRVLVRSIVLINML